MAKKTNFLKRIVQWSVRLLVKALVAILAITFFSVLLLRWINPWTSSIMIQRKVEALSSPEQNASMQYNWVNFDAISPHMAVAIIAAEDQRFPTHFGFDLHEIGKAIEQHGAGKKLRGASTISQQVAKNLYLWEGGGFFRKGIEAYFTFLIEVCWSKERILEVYLNIAEMGNMVFGVEAASNVYYKKEAAGLQANQAALLAAILPGPKIYSVKSPSSYTLKRQNWILHQMKNLGGPNYLNNLYPE